MSRAWSQPCSSAPRPSRTGTPTTSGPSLPCCILDVSVVVFPTPQSLTQTKPRPTLTALSSLPALPFLPPSLPLLGATRVAAASARTMVPRRSMGIFHPLAMKPYELPKTQKVRKEGGRTEGGMCTYVRRGDEGQRGGSKFLRDGDAFVCLF